MNQARLYIIVLLFFSTHIMIAQTASVSGSIKDNDTYLPGATISISGTSIGTTTDYNGDFELNKLEPGQIELEISFIGYASKTMTIALKAGEQKKLGTIVLNVDAETLNEVVVVGDIVKGEMRALNTQRVSNKIINVISADGIGKLPDRNAAEAVQRIPGVSIERDQGEGRFVAVRGLPSQWSSSSLNGDRLPTAEEETTTRATAFDFFPSDMIQFVEVSKALTPDQEGDGIGGNVNFITRTAPKKRTLNIAIGGGYNTLAQKPIFSGNILYGDKTKDGKFGFFLNGTAWVRNWATDNYEPRRGGDGLGIRRLELRDYTGIRETYGINGAAEFKPNAYNKFYIRGLFGTLRDNETHYKHRLRFDKNRVEVQHIYNTLITQMIGGEIGGEHKVKNGLKLDWKAASYHNSFFYGDTPNADDKSYFVVRFDQKNVGYQGLEDRGAGNLAYNTIDRGTNRWNSISNHLPNDFQMDPAKTRLAWVELYKVYINERDKIVLQANITNTVNDKLELKFGAKYRNKERIAEFADEFYEWDKNAGPTPTLADFNLADQPDRKGFLKGVNVDYASQFSQVASKEAIVNWYNANKQHLVLVPEESALLENGGALGRHFKVYEHHISGYGMATYKASPKFTIMGGLRLTQTITEVDGHVYVTNENTGENSLHPHKGKKNYLSVLPALHLKYSLNELTNFRFAITRTFARPDFGSLSPGATYAEHDNQFFSGNPNLNPTYSLNFDLMAEHYFGKVGVISGGFFYKVISDPIFNSSRVGEYNGKTGVTFFQPLNGDNGWLYGVELNFNKKFDFLPGFLSHFGLSANYTFMQSEFTIPGRDDKVSIPRQADHLFNIALFFDNGKFNTRLALNHKGPYIEEYGGSPTFDSYYGKYTSLDWSASFKINKKIMVYAELNNLTNEPLIYYLGEKERPLQVEYYQLRGQIGLKINLF